MNFTILETSHNELTLRIEEDYPEVGAYLYVFRNGKCIEDHLQNDIETCKQIAFEKYGVLPSEWRVK